MKRGNGFTLIELLAVIVILAIIALIATPLIMNIINDVKKSSFKSSSLGIIKAAEQGYSLAILDNFNSVYTEYKFSNGQKMLEKGNITLKYKGASPKDGSLIINENGDVAIALYDGIYCATKRYKDDDVVIIKSKSEECIIEKIVDVSGVNAPILATGMIPVKWDKNNNEIETTSDDEEWYNYSDQKWANVKTQDGSYFVWIPRYAYKITSGYHSNSAGTIDVVFLKVKTTDNYKNVLINTQGYDINVTNTSNSYFLHPAFNYDSKLGFWVAKYEATAMEGISNKLPTSDWLCPNNNDNVTTKTVQFIPNASSWRCITIANAYKLSVGMKEKESIYGWKANEVDPHMITNYEWGAISYLAQSKYGTDAKAVWNNSYNEFKTGCGSSSINALNESTCIEYNTENGVKASTTHNIYGVYDMSGGGWDRTMAIYNNLINDSGFTVSELANIPLKHINYYITPSENLLNGIGVDYDLSYYGDAVYESSSGAKRYNGTEWVGTGSSWYGGYSNLPRTNVPGFFRGGHFNTKGGSSVFSFHAAGGGVRTHYTFRSTIAILNN